MMRKQLWKWTILLVLPIALFAVIRERRSWQPRTFNAVAEIYQMAFAADGQRLIVQPNNSIKFLDVTFGNTLPVKKTRFAGVLSPDEKTLASIKGVGTVELWNVATDRLKRTLSKRMGAGLSIKNVRFSPDGKILAESRDNGGLPPHLRGAILLWDTQTGKLKRTLSTGGNTVDHILWAPDGRTLVGSGVYATQIWDLPSGKLRFKLAPTREQQEVAVDANYAHLNN